MEFRAVNIYQHLRQVSDSDRSMLMVYVKIPGQEDFWGVDCNFEDMYLHLMVY
jgi:hypothetical protein